MCKREPIAITDIYPNILRSPEHELIAKLLEDSCRDIGLLVSNRKKRAQGKGAYLKLRNASDWFFIDDPEIPFSCLWIVNNLPDIDDRFIAAARKFIMTYWTPKRVKKLLAGKLTDSPKDIITKL